MSFMVMAQHTVNTFAKKRQQQQQREAILNAINEDTQDRKRAQALKAPMQASAAECEHEAAGKDAAKQLQD
jgi:hypothetical protein